VMTYFNAIEGRRMDDLLKLLDEYQMEATLLTSDSPAALLMDHAPGWTRLYADDVAVIHVRSRPSGPQATPAASGALNN
jgi:hypothetical protein